MSCDSQVWLVPSHRSSPIQRQEQEQQQERLRGRRQVRFAPGTVYRRSARLHSPPPPPPTLSPLSEHNLETIDLPAQSLFPPLAATPEGQFATTVEVTPRSAPILVPGKEPENIHADGSAVLWELTRFGKIPFVPHAVRPKRSLREITRAPAGYTWHHVLGCWALDNDSKTGMWGTPNLDVSEQKKQSNDDYDPGCALADDDEENEEYFTLLDPAKELERSRRRVFVEYRDVTGAPSVVFRQGEEHRAINAARRYFLKY